MVVYKITKILLYLLNVKQKKKIRRNLKMNLKLLECDAIEN